LDQDQSLDRGIRLSGVEERKKIRHKLYQGIQTDGAANDTPKQGKGKENEPLFLEGGRGGGGHGGMGKFNER
jgi:hypothetical protein